MLQRHDLEIHRLHRRPEHPILLQRLHVRAPQLLPRIPALHVRHAREEAEQVRGREDCLVCRYARGDGEVWPRGKVDPSREEGEPGRCCGAEDAWLGFGVLVSRSVLVKLSRNDGGNWE